MDQGARTVDRRHSRRERAVLAWGLVQPLGEPAVSLGYVFDDNVSGSFLIGSLTVVLARWMPHPHLRLLLITGFLGGYTTFSTFQNDWLLILWERGEGLLMSANLVGSVVLGFAAVVLGTAAARGLAEPRMHRDGIAGSMVETQKKIEHPGSGLEHRNAKKQRRGRSV